MPFWIFYYENITLNKYYFLKHAPKNKVFTLSKNRKKRNKRKRKRACFLVFKDSKVLMKIEASLVSGQ